jgi:branched-chain amino acid transport system substrate-binding protein
MMSKNMLFKLGTLCIAIVLSVMLILSSCTPSTPGAKTLKIGGSQPLSGPPSAAGLAFKRGWDLAVEKINKDGGLNIGGTSYMIELLVEDSKASAEGGTTVATKLCHQDGVKFLIGDLTDFMVPPIYEVTSEAGALFCIALLNAPADMPGSVGDVGPDKPLLIRMAPAAAEVCNIPAKYLAENYPNVKTVSLMCLGFPYFEPFQQKFAADWAPLGLTVNSNFEMFPPDCMDFNPLVTRVLADKPDAIFLISSTLSQFSLVVKAARDAGFNGPILYGVWAEPGYAAEAMPNLSDVVSLGMPMDDPSLPDEIKEVIEMGYAKYGVQDFVEDGVFAYDQIMLMAQVMEKAQSLDPQEVMNTFETLTEPGDLQSVFGPAHVGGLQTYGVNRVLVKPVPMSRLVNGQGEFIGMFTAEIP